MELVQKPWIWLVSPRFKQLNDLYWLKTVKLLAEIELTPLLEIFQVETFFTNKSEKKALYLKSFYRPKNFITDNQNNSG